MFSINKNPTTAELRKFGFAILSGFGVLAMAIWILTARAQGSTFGWTGKTGQFVALWFFALGAFLAIVSLIAPSVARSVYIAWMTVTLPIGIVMSVVLLTVLFFLLLPIFSVIVRFGDPLRKKWKTGSTYWEDYKAHEPTLERMRRLF